MKTKLHYVLSIAIFFFMFSAVAQNSTWEKIETIDSPENLSKLNLDNKKVHLFKLNSFLLNQDILSTPLRSAAKKSTEKIVDIPSLNGELESFKLYEAPVFAPELAAKYPNIKSYVGISTKDSRTRLRMSVSHNGVQTMISYVGKPTVFMQPVKKGGKEYVLYEKHSKSNKLASRFECKTIDELNESLSNKSGKSSKGLANEGGANDKTLQKFRMAVSTTAEYTSYHGNEIDALAAINATLARVNQVFETDMAVTFELIANNNFIIYTNPTSDPYSDASNSDNWNSELQSTLTSVIGEANYDIGHLFAGSGGGGNAGCIGCVCVNGSKGSGYSASGAPEGENFDIDLVAHEIGHQMGGNHTWAFRSEGTGVNSEPGSGTTIMAYAGITGNNNVAMNSDDYFHYQSIKQILDNLATKSCQTTEIITNNPPVADAGNDFNIPKGTAYVLKGSATDPDGGDNLTYCWEQIDSGVTNYQNFGPTLASQSMNRSLPPTGAPDRYIPRFTSVVAGNTIQANPSLGSDWETVSTVARTLNWALTVRDRNPATASGGQTSYDTMQITVEDVTPFTVVNPVSWVQGSNTTIEWVVGQTNNGTINCQTVNIKLSTDGGVKFKTTIASGVPNNGSYTYAVPPGLSDTSNARILIESADNIFYDVSDFNFSISSDPDFFIINEALTPIACEGTIATFTFDYEAVNGFSETTTFSATGNPGASIVTFSPTSRNSSGSVTMTISNLDAVPVNNYTINLIATPDTSPPKNKNVPFPFFNGQCISEANTEYDTGTTLVQFNTINQASGKPSGYSDYTAVSTDLNRNSSYDITVNANTDGDFTTATKVWIDWNQNCSFDDAGEEYNLGDANNTADGATGGSPLSITIPSDAILGNTIMRVSTKFKGDGLPTACDNGFDGEVEDYTINVQASLSVEEFGFDNFAVFPNPNKGEFTIKLNSSLSSDVKVEVFDLRGRSIYKNRYKDTGDFNEKINLNNVQSGMYILSVNDDKRKSTKKIIVE